MALRPTTVDIMRQRYPQLGPPGGIAPPLNPAAAAAQARLSGQPPGPPMAPPMAPPPMAPPAMAPAPVRLPGPPKAPPGLVLAQQNVTPGQDTSAARAANTEAAEGEATAIEKAGADAAAGYRAESEAKAIGALTQNQQVTMQAAAQNDIKRKAEGRVQELLGQKDPKVDPRKFFKELGVGGTALAIAAAGLTAGLRAVANNKSQVAGQAAPFDLEQNPVIDSMIAQVKQSIALQQDEIANGRTDRAQQLSIEMQRWGNAEQAELALQSKAMDALARYNDTKAEQHRGTAIEANAKQNAAAARSRATQINGQLSLLEQDRASYSFQRPTPAAGGEPGKKLGEWNSLYDSAVKQGRSKKTAAALANGFTGLQLPVPEGVSEADISRNKAATDAENADLDQHDADWVGKIVGKRVSPKQAAEIKANAKALATVEGEVAGAKSMTKDLVEAAGATIDMQTGKVSWPDDLKGAGVGAAAADAVGSLAGPFVTTNREILQDKQKALKEFVTSNLTGANASIRQERTFAQMVGGEMLDEDRAKASLQAWADTLWSKSKANRAGSPEAAKLYDHSQGQQQQSEQIEVTKR